MPVPRALASLGLMSGPPVLVWFRNDLRLADHAALDAAIETGRPLVPVFILDDEAAGPWSLGGASRWWLHHSLVSLDRALHQRGARLLLRRGETSAALSRLAAQTGGAEVFAGAAVEPWARRLEQRLRQDGIALRLFRTVSLFDPGTLRTQSGGPFSVYSPFSRAAFAAGVPPPPLPAAERIPTLSEPPASDLLGDWNLLPRRPDWADGLRETWRPGEAHALERLRAFLGSSLETYAADRDRPATDGTSMLSPHLHFGEISPAQVWHAAATCAAPAAHRFLCEQLWREFSINLLWYHQKLPEEPLLPAFANMPWRHDEAALRAWQRGRTGIPIVDAGMRQLWHTGWMHNRVRMIAASFLVKHLLILWQQGEAWFWDTLVDADLANNSASWQWVAGSGADAAPYFRIFNPVLQGKKFDPDGDYVRTWVPELSALDAGFVHNPWDAPPLILRQAGIELGRTYPHPIIDLQQGRQRALRAFASL